MNVSESAEFYVHKASPESSQLLDPSFPSAEEAIGEAKRWVESVGYMAWAFVYTAGGKVVYETWAPGWHTKGGERRVL